MIGRLIRWLNGVVTWRDDRLDMSNEIRRLNVAARREFVAFQSCLDRQDTLGCATHAINHARLKKDHADLCDEYERRFLKNNKGDNK